MGLIITGCNGKNKGRLDAFLMKPRSPVSGLEYIVLPPDALSITSIRVSEINNLTQRVRPDGKIVLPLLGEVFVAGKTPKEIESVIIEASKEYYKEADVSVQVTGYFSQKFYVFGQVAQPGPIQWTGSDTLIDVLARVQPTHLARPEKIKVIRARPPRKGGYLPPPDEQMDEVKRAYEAAGFNETGAEEMTVNLMAMMRTGDMSRNILLCPDDVIYVPPNPFAAVGLALQTILFPTRPVAEVIRLPYEYDLYYSRGMR